MSIQPKKDRDCIDDHAKAIRLKILEIKELLQSAANECPTRDREWMRFQQWDDKLDCFKLEIERCYPSSATK